MATLGSYGMDLLRWFRPVGGRGELGPGEPDRGTRPQPWLQLAGKPARVHWRRRGQNATGIDERTSAAPLPGTVNPVTGRPLLGTRYAATAIAHSVLAPCSALSTSSTPRCARGRSSTRSRWLSADSRPASPVGQMSAFRSWGLGSAGVERDQNAGLVEFLA